MKIWTLYGIAGLHLLSITTGVLLKTYRRAYVDLTTWGTLSSPSITNNVKYVYFINYYFYSIIIF